MGLYQKIRPTELNQVIGQASAVAQLRTMLEKDQVPHAILFSGPSGTGKTTLARIMAAKLGSGGFDLVEKNCAAENGIDMVRDINSSIPMRTLSGKPRVYIIDEGHQVSSAGQRALLKTLEDTPPHVYFFFCTTNPEKLEKPLRNRCTHITLLDVPTTVIKAYLKQACPDTELSEKALLQIAEAAEGSVRRALVMLEQVMMAGESHIAEILDNPSEVSDGLFQVVRAVYSKKQIFPQFAPEFAEMQENQVEGFRRTILSYGAAILVKGKNPTAVAVMDAFKDPFWNSGKNGVILALSKLQ